MCYAWSALKPHFILKEKGCTAYLYVVVIIHIRVMLWPCGFVRFVVAIVECSPLLYASITHTEHTFVKHGHILFSAVRESGVHKANCYRFMASTREVFVQWSHYIQYAQTLQRPPLTVSARPSSHLCSALWQQTVHKIVPQLAHGCSFVPSLALLPVQQ